MRSTRDSTSANLQLTFGDLQRQLAEARAELARRPRAGLRCNTGKAMLCEAAFGVLHTYDGERFDPVAMKGVPDAFAEFLKHDRPAFGPGTGPVRLLEGERVVHDVDLANTEPYLAGEPNRVALVELGGARSLVTVPLLKDEVVHGTITIYRQEPRPFTDKQVALLQIFAAQAVIAIENARLIDRNARGQETFSRCSTPYWKRLMHFAEPLPGFWESLTTGRGARSCSVVVGAAGKPPAAIRPQLG